MAERNRRSTARSGRGTSERRGTSRTTTRKKKKNRLPLVAVCVLLLVIVVIFNAVSGRKSGSGDGQGIFLSGQPEFFSTIKPESLNTAEIDTADDLTKAATYFENSLFIGGSQMQYIQNAKLSNERIGTILGQALFMTETNYTWQAMANEFSGGALTFNLYGDYVSVTGAIEKAGAEKVFLQLGRADLAAGDVSAALTNARAALLSLKAATQAEVVVLSLAPNTAESTAVPDNSTMQTFNSGLQQICGELGITFADTGEIFDSFELPAEYCADTEGTCLNTEGSLLWVNELLEIVSTPQSTPAPSPTEAPTTESTPEPTGNGGIQAADNGINAAGRAGA